MKRKKKAVIEAAPFFEENEAGQATVQPEVNEKKQTEKVKKTNSRSAALKNFVNTKLLTPDTDKFTFISTLINMVASVLWMIIYVFLLMYRDSVFSSIELGAALNIPTYTVTFTTPMFAVLRVFLYIMPVVYIVWAVAVSTASKRNKKLCHRVLLYITLGLDFFVAVLTLFDLSAANLIFGVIA